jgi:hypothetical protein
MFSRIRSSRTDCRPNEPQLRPVPLGGENRALPLAGQVLESVGVEQRLVELAPLTVISESGG